MTTRQAAACILILSLAAAGCSHSDSHVAATANAPPASSTGSAEAAASAANDGLVATPAVTPTTPTPIAPPVVPAAAPQDRPPQDPPPTAEQIARWTPPPFEPLQLLAVCEWKETSFTSRLAAAPDGAHFIVVGSRVLLWPLTADEPEHVFLDLTADDADRELKALAVSPDGKWFAVGDSAGTLRIWSLEERKELVSKQLYDNDITYIAISPDASEIATISYDRDVAIWTADTLDPKQKFEVGTSGAERIEYAGPNLLAAAGESTAIWNSTTGAKTHDLPAGRYNDALVRTPDGAKLIFGAEDALHLWDVAAGKPDATVIRGVAGNVLLAVAPDGKTLATSDGRSVDLWSLADGRRLQSIQGFGWTIVGVSWLPKTSLLAVASDGGVTRIWGTPTQGEPLGLKPVHTLVEMPEVAAKTPATPEQLEQMIDWRTFPTLPGGVSNVQSPTDLHGTASVGIAEARAFYRYFLTKAGWTESPQDPNNPTSMTFHKDGSEISGYFYDAGDGKTSITLHHGGSYDVRWAPKADAAEIQVVYEDAGSSSYRAKAGILQIETSLLRKLHEAGWAAYARLNSSYSEEPDKRDFEFLRNGVTLRVSIGKFPDDTAETYTVQYSLFPNDTWAPVPPDAGFVEFDGSTEPALIAITTMSLPEAHNFYDRELTSYGWLTRQIGRSLKDEQYWLPYLRGQCNLTVSISKLPDGRTLVRIGDVSGSMWEAAQHKDDEGDEPPAAGLQAADFPLLNATKTGKFDSLGKTIEVPMEGSTLANAAEIYTKALGDLGWKAAEGGIRDEEYTFFDFTKDDQNISLRARKRDGAAVVNFEGDGLLWTKELPGRKQVVSYETWLRLSKLPPSLEFLDGYEMEMKAIAAK
jgi:WD40 repeat protein